MKRPYFFFHQLGYRANPFGALTPAEWGAIAVMLPAVRPALLVATAHTQLLGPMGSGKTTSLLGLQAHLGAQAGGQIVYEYLPEGQTYYQTDPTGLALFLLDEAQRLNWWQRRRLVKAVVNGRFRLVLSSHEDLTPLFARRGISLATVRLTEMVSREQYQAILQRRLDYFALPGVERVTLGETAVQFLLDTFGQNLREAEYFLYDVWQRQTHPHELTATHLAACWREMEAQRRENGRVY